MKRSPEVINTQRVDVLRAGNPDAAVNVVGFHQLGQNHWGMGDHAASFAEAGADVSVPNIFHLYKELRLQGQTPSLRGLVDVFDNLGVVNKDKPTILVGLSTGGAMGLEYAAKHPDEVDYVVAASPIGEPIDRTRWGWAFETAKMNFQALSYPNKLRSQTPKPGIFGEDLQSVWDVVKLAMEGDCRGIYSQVTSPVLILTSRRDTTIPYDGLERMAAALPNAEGPKIVSELGHTWYELDYQQIVDPVVARIRRILASS